MDTFLGISLAMPSAIEFTTGVSSSTLIRLRFWCLSSCSASMRRVCTHCRMRMSWRTGSRLRRSVNVVLIAVLMSRSLSSSAFMRSAASESESSSGIDEGSERDMLLLRCEARGETGEKGGVPVGGVADEERRCLGDVAGVMVGEVGEEDSLLEDIRLRTLVCCEWRSMYAWMSWACISNVRGSIL